MALKGTTYVDPQKRVVSKQVGLRTEQVSFCEQMAAAAGLRGGVSEFVRQLVDLEAERQGHKYE